MMRFRFFTLFISFGLLLSGRWAYAQSLDANSAANQEAFYIEPKELRISSEDDVAALSRSKLKLVNKEPHDVVVRIDCFLRDDDANGNERRAPTKDVKVDTPEFTLPAGSSRDVTVQYSGARNIARERTYRIVVKQRGDGEGDNHQRSLDLDFIHVVSFFVVPRAGKVKVDD